MARTYEHCYRQPKRFEGVQSFQNLGAMFTTNGVQHKTAVDDGSASAK